VTAEPYAAAAGLIERFAVAYSCAVSADPRDDGFFGPASVTWRVSTDLSAPVAFLRSLMMQALHPLVMAGVDQHSGWRRDPVGRLAATNGYAAEVTYGDRDSARRAAQRVRAIHEHVCGTDIVTGLPYAATDPVLLLWVHAAFVDSALAAIGLFGTPLAAAGTGRRPVRPRDDDRSRAARGSAGDDPAGCRCPAPVQDSHPAAATLHARCRGGDGLVAGPARDGG
jgi:hypothetical protein